MKTSRFTQYDVRWIDAHLPAEEYVARLRANTDAYYEDEVSYEEFGAAQRVLWDAIDAAGLAPQVLALLRNAPRVTA